MKTDRVAEIRDLFRQIEEARRTPPPGLQPAPLPTSVPQVEPLDVPAEEDELQQQFFIRIGCDTMEY